ncbi:MAG: prolyl oligopeptidase family serine peptidase [Gammaproteobacteria bacterium]|nr:prolyl oligopeptidase family serine peptidase [Gammaproteobacteria bacterium]
MHDDLIDGINWAVDNGIADPKHIAIMGRSYGGYATLVGLTMTPETFACGVDIVGPADLESLSRNFPACQRSHIKFFCSAL